MPSRHRCNWLRDVETRRIVRRETLISVLINAAISAAMFALLFGIHAPAAVKGTMGYATDFLPQLFMISLMGGLVPGLLTLRRHAAQDSVRLFGFRGATAVVARALLVAVAAAMVLGVPLCALFYLFAPAQLPPIQALAIKISVGALVAALITPPAVRHALQARASKGI